ncbi:MAG: 2'-5' RNA ligase family protein [Janthinobacterium lividum]
MTTQHDDGPETDRAAAPDGGPERAGEAGPPTGDPRAPLLLTLQLAEPAQSLFQTLRNRHFPADRNVVPAHVSLFHHLPGEERRPITKRLREIETTGLPSRPVVRVEAPFPLGRGVGFRLQAPVLKEMHAKLAADWADWLTPQDRQGWRPHVTVQNKVSPEVARAALDQLQRGFVPFETEGACLHLWRYLGGPWERLETFTLKVAEPPRR